MIRALKEALAQCLARLEAGANIEDCLRGQGSLAAELRPLLEAARALHVQGGRIPEHTPAALQRGRTRMQASRARQAEGAGGSPWTGIFGRPAALLAMAAVVAVVAALGFTTDLFRFGADTTSAHVEGVVSRVDPDVIVLVTVDGQVIIRIGENTTVFDADGNIISGGDIVPGRRVEVEVEVEDGDFAAQRIEVRVEVEGEDEVGHGAEVEFSGVVKTVSDGTITLQASFGDATVRVGPQTEVKDVLAEGLTVEVHATLQPDGSYLAREIEAEGTEDDDIEGHSGERDDDDDSERSDNSGPG